MNKEYKTKSQNKVRTHSASKTNEVARFDVLKALLAMSQIFEDMIPRHLVNSYR